jgi:hypothetical protein
MNLNTVITIEVSPAGIKRAHTIVRTDREWVDAAQFLARISKEIHQLDKAAKDLSVK